ncbi:MAG: tRNA modification GTPase [Anaerohalosphaeraceae bacterium]|jgi:tRNA modification GTPase
MFRIDDTIAAVSTATVPVGAAGRNIIRVCGPDTFTVLSKIVTAAQPIPKNRISRCLVHVDDQLDIDGLLYAFFQPHSYTGQDLAELHLDACGAVIAAVLEKLYQYVRPAAAGEFTQRAFLNGKMDLTQAEAVAEIVSAANTTQLAAAERLLHGRFSDTIAMLRTRIIELLGRLEAGLDFSEEDIVFISTEDSLKEVDAIRQQLLGLLEGSVRCERIIDMDSVGLAGVPNAGKSRLLNTLLGHSRSIVSDTEATTRDVLTGLLKLENIDCVLFDCAGLLNESQQDAQINQLSHEASLAALNTAAVILFCVDAGKQDLEAEKQMRRQIAAETVLYVMTKIDTVTPEQLAQQQATLGSLFGGEFILTSAVTQEGLESLKKQIQAQLLRRHSAEREYESRHMINQRHERKLTEVIQLLGESAHEIKGNSTEVTAMLLRQVYGLLGGLETEDISETILDDIFSRFCIGK